MTTEPASEPTTSSDRLVHTGAEPRLTAVSIVRAAMVAITGLVATFAPSLEDQSEQRLTMVVIIWAALMLATEMSRRADFGVSITIRGAFLLDGLLLSLATVADGGTESPLFFLAFVHVISVTLLASYLTGLKAAVWDSMLLLVAAAAQTAGAIPFLPAGDGAQAAAALIRAVALLAVTAVTAGASALNERELRRSRAGLQTMLGTGEALMGAAEAEEAIQIVLASLCGPMGFASATVLITPRAAGSALVGRRDQTGPGSPIRTDRRLAVLVPGQTILRADAADLAPIGLADLLAGQTNVVVVPVRGRLLTGVIAASLGGRPRRRGLPVRTLELLQSLSTQLTQTLDRIHLAEALEATAALDGLTGVPNRRRFDERFEQMLTAAQRTRSPLSVMAIDIDHFKAVNDDHGHQVGDEVLKAVARALQGEVRSEDLVARYGGEEFAILLPDTHLDAAVPLADRVRARVAEADSLVAVTVSIGVASSAVSGLDSGTLFGAADRALYAAKEDGRNRVRVAAPAVERIPPAQTVRIPHPVG